MTTSKKIRAQRAYVAQCESALRHYVSEGKAGRASFYGNLSGLIRTSQDVVYVQTGKLMRMEQEAEAHAGIPMRNMRDFDHL